MSKTGKARTTCSDELSAINDSGSLADTLTDINGHSDSASPAEITVHGSQPESHDDRQRSKYLPEDSRTSVAGSMAYNIEPGNMSTFDRNSEDEGQSQEVTSLQLDMNVNSPSEPLSRGLMAPVLISRWVGSWTGG
jgi:hypothetical protein